MVLVLFVAIGRCLFQNVVPLQESAEHGLLPVADDGFLNDIHHRQPFVLLEIVHGEGVVDEQVTSLEGGNPVIQRHPFVSDGVDFPVDGLLHHIDLMDGRFPHIQHHDSLLVLEQEVSDKSRDGNAHERMGHTLGWPLLRAHHFCQLFPIDHVEQCQLVLRKRFEQLLALRQHGLWLRKQHRCHLGYALTGIHLLEQSRYFFRAGGTITEEPWQSRLVALEVEHGEQSRSHQHIVCLSRNLSA